MNRRSLLLPLGADAEVLTRLYIHHGFDGSIKALANG